jgi:hypothetical protein
MKLAAPLKIFVRDWYHHKYELAADSRDDDGDTAHRCDHDYPGLPRCGVANPGLEDWTGVPLRAHVFSLCLRGDHPPWNFAGRTDGSAARSEMPTAGQVGL